jgi:hypothetical protein
VPTATRLHKRTLTVCLAALVFGMLGSSCNRVFGLEKLRIADVPDAATSSTASARPDAGAPLSAAERSNMGGSMAQTSLDASSPDERPSAAVSGDAGSSTLPSTGGTGGTGGNTATAEPRAGATASTTQPGQAGATSNAGTTGSVESTVAGTAGSQRPTPGLGVEDDAGSP